MNKGKHQLQGGGPDDRPGGQQKLPWSKERTHTTNIHPQVGAVPGQGHEGAGESWFTLPWGTPVSQAHSPYPRVTLSWGNFAVGCLLLVRAWWGN